MDPQVNLDPVSLVFHIYALETLGDGDSLLVSQSHVERLMAQLVDGNQHLLVPHIDVLVPLTKELTLEFLRKGLHTKNLGLNQCPRKQ